MGRKEQRERERKKAAKESHALSGFGFLPKKRSWSDGDLNATATSQRQLVEEDSSSRSSLQLQEQDEGSSLQSCSSTKVSVKLIVIFVPAGLQNVSPVLNGLARLRATAKWQITPACDFRESILIPFFFFFWFVCMSKVILSFRFYSRLGLPAGRRSGSITLDRDEAKSTSSARLLNLFWWPFLPLFHCEKECLSVPSIRRLFWVVFFLLAVHLVATYGRKPISQSQKNRIFQT